MVGEIDGGTSSANGRPVSVQERAERLDALGGFLGGPLRDFERIGRLQLEVLIHEGLYPTSKTLDVGCGCLRGGYWLMHFLEPGRYFGIEPFRHRLQAGLEHIVEAELVERAKPTFAHNDDFDLSVFGTKFDFVVARSIWTHASKPQLQRMLDSFVAVGEPGAVLLASYLPASRMPDALKNALDHLARWTPKLSSLRRRVFGRDDHGRDSWSLPVVGQRTRWLIDECRSRGLGIRELDYGVMNSQVWLRVDHP